MSPVAPSRRRQVLDVFREAGDAMTLAEVAAQLDVHPNTVRFHVDRLLEAGQIEQVDVARQGPGRPAAHFRATHRMDPGGPRQYQKLAEVLVSALASTSDRRERARAAGEHWGAMLAQERADEPGSCTDRLVSLLAEVGFDPRPSRRGSTDEIALRHCPFLELAQDRTEVICPIHLGLMQGALQEWGADVEKVRLQPFLEPDLCLARLEHARTG